MKKIEEFEIVGKIYRDYLVDKIVERRSGGILISVICQKCGRTRQVWLRDIRANKGSSHQWCVTTLDKCEIYKKLYTVHSGIKTRTKNTDTTKSGKRYKKYYGDKNITYDAKFEFFIDFYDIFKPMLEKAVIELNVPLEKLSFDRIDNNKGYFVENLRFTTQDVQIKNSSNVLGRKIIFTNRVDGSVLIFKNKTVQEIANYFETTLGTMRGRIYRKKYGDYDIEVKTCND